MHVETIDFYCIETYDFELINIVFPGIAEGADLNTYIMKIKVGNNDYKMKLQNNISSYDLLRLISDGNRTEWSPILSVIIQVITKSDDSAAGVRFVSHEYDYRPNWTTRSLITN